MDESRGVSHEDIYHRLGSLEGKLDAAITKMTDFKRDLDTCYGRIRTLEAHLNKAVGIAIVLSIIIPVGLNMFTSNYHLHFSNQQDQPRIR
jgi:hypothetical protein